MALITYADKQAMGTQPSIPSVNKVMDTDLNQIKNAINNSTTYSNSETLIGYWIDNKPIYRTVLTYNNVTNSTTSKDITSLNIDSLVSMRYTGVHGENKDVGNFYTSESDRLRIFCRLSDSTDTLQIRLSSEQTFTLYVILEYTKTTD